jgi:hypothetical protein
VELVLFEKIFPDGVKRVCCAVHKLIFPCALFLAAASSLPAIPVGTTLVLTSEPAYNVLTVTLDPVVGFDLSSTDSSRMTGSIQVLLDIDPATATTPILTMVEGRTHGTNLRFRNGFFYDMTFRGASAFIRTPVAPGIVTPATGLFAANQYRFDIDQGVLSGTALGNPVSRTFTPEAPSAGLGTGSGSILLTSLGDSGLFRNFDVMVTIPVSNGDSFLSDTITVNVNATGTLRALGTVQVPRTAYIDWSIRQNQPGAPFLADPESDGIPHGLLWALGLSVTDDPRPNLLRPDPDLRGAFLFTLPDAGSAAPILIESSTDLTHWSPVPSASLTGLSNPVPARSRGDIRIAPSDAPQRFLRLSVLEP